MKYFKEKEFNNFNMVDSEVKSRLDIYREYLGYPVIITSDYEQSGHSENSEHYQGMAVDCKSKAPLWWQYICAERAGFENIGLYPAWNGLHVGVRGMDSRRWIGLGFDAKQEYARYNKDNFIKYILKEEKDGNFI